MKQEVQIKEAGNGGLFKKAFNAAEQVVQAGLEVDKLKVKASNVIEDGMADAKRLVRKGRYAAEDLVDETAYRIKREPFWSVGITFGVGLGVGAFAGWALTRAFKEKVH